MTRSTKIFIHISEVASCDFSILCVCTLLYYYTFVKSNLCLPVSSILGRFIRFCFRKCNNIIFFFVHCYVTITVTIISWFHLAKKIIKSTFQIHYNTTDCTGCNLNCYHTQVKPQNLKTLWKNRKHVHTKSVNDY